MEPEDDLMIDTHAESLKSGESTEHKALSSEDPRSSNTDQSKQEDRRRNGGHFGFDTERKVQETDFPDPREKGTASLEIKAEKPKGIQQSGGKEAASNEQQETLKKKSSALDSERGGGKNPRLDEEEVKAPRPSPCTPTDEDATKKTGGKREIKGKGHSVIPTNDQEGDSPSKPNEDDDSISSGAKGSSSCGGKTMDLEFSIKYNASFGEGIFLTGNHPTMGNWVPENGVELMWSEGNVWRATVNFSEMPTFEYKYVCIGPKGMRWEGGANHSLSQFIGEADPMPPSIFIEDSWKI